MTTENITTEKIIAEASDKGVSCRDLLGEGGSQTPRTDAEILLCSDGTTAVPASLARMMEREIAVLTKCHEDNCRSISQLAHELGQSRDAERLARVQLEKAREKRDESAMSDNDARIFVGRTAKRGGWNA